MVDGRVKIGIVGCGTISGIYLKNCLRFEHLEVAAVADLNPEAAAAKAREFGIPRVCAVKEMLADPGIQIIVNLTIPKAHGEVALAAVEAGKSVYNEKPLTLARGDARQLLRLAKRKKVLAGCAPDTFMGAGMQTCRKLIDDGSIGEPVGATAFMVNHGPESWHPSPEFYYQNGGGPMFDMGPYYLTALISLMGPVKRVTGSARITFPERTITSQPKNGTKIKVEVPTHVAGVLDFASGAIAAIITSFDVWASMLPRIEIYGTKGSLQVPDPNGFGGQVRIRRAGVKEWEDVPLTHSYAENSRGMGVADLASALVNGRTHRASGELAFHVLDVMHAIHDASQAGKHIQMKSTCARPDALPVLKEWSRIE